MKKHISIPVWVVVVFILLLPVYVALANTQYRRLAVFNSTIDSTTLGATTPSTIAGTTLKVNTSMLSSTGFKHQRFGATCATAATALSSCSQTLTWATPFPDANYTPVCWGHDGLNEPAYLAEQAGARTAASISVLVIATINQPASFNGVNCIAFHD